MWCMSKSEAGVSLWLRVEAWNVVQTPRGRPLQICYTIASLVTLIRPR